MKGSLLRNLIEANGCGEGAVLAGLLAFCLGSASAALAQSQAEGQGQWDETVAAAKKEGRVVVYHGSDTETVFASFQKKYPEIKFVSVTGPTGPSGLSSRILMEQRSGKFIGDLYILGATTAYMVLDKRKAFDPVKPALMLPEVKDPSKWYGGRHHYIDERGDTILAFNGDVSNYYGYNSKLVDPGEFQSYWDLLDPKWKGKIIALDPAWGGPVSAPLRFIWHHPDLGQKFLMRLLTDMEMTPSRRSRQIVDWLATGRFSLSAFTRPSREGLDDAKRQGLAVDWFGPKAFKEGTIINAGSGCVMLFRNAPHPNAARVAVNWLLSREGQMVYQKVRRSDSRRIDIPKDDVAPYNRRVEGLKGVETDQAKFMEITPILNFVKKHFKPKKL